MGRRKRNKAGHKQAANKRSGQHNAARGAAARETTAETPPQRSGPLDTGQLETGPLKSAWRRRLETMLFAPVDIAGLVYFRIAFYAVMTWEALRLGQEGWVEKYFSGKEIYFKYWPFTFVEPMSASAMDNLLLFMAVVAFLALAGFLYRLNATLFFLAFTYLVLIEQARFQNHMYLVCLVSFLMIFLPAHRALSVDAQLRPRLAVSHIPAWPLQLLRFQIAIPYFFGGIAKLNGDWLRGVPMRDWIAKSTDFPIVGRFFGHESTGLVMSYGGLFLDLTAGFLLLFRRTRVPTFAVLLAFHLTNSRLFNIGIFPWLMIAATMLFFPPDWPRRLLQDLRTGTGWRRAAFLGGILLGALAVHLLETESWVKMGIGALGGGLLAAHLGEPFARRRARDISNDTPASTGLTAPGAMTRRRVLIALGLWCAVQVLLPLRHYLIPGNVHWTDEGHLFAWHMKIRDKFGQGVFVIEDPETRRRWPVNPADHLSSFQLTKMYTRPQQIVQFARHLEDQKREEGYQDVEVRARIQVRLNGRPAVPFVDSNVDLTAVPFPWLGHAAWIRPLDEPLPER